MNVFVEIHRNADDMLDGKNPWRTYRANFADAHQYWVFQMQLKNALRAGQCMTVYRAKGMK